MQNGISIYLGLDNTLEENLNLIHLAHKYNLNRIFTSFHIPETDISHFQQDLQTILKLTQKYNMEVICDVSPNTLALLNLDTLNIQELSTLGITTRRLDFGYSAEQIAKLSHQNIKLQFNASTITQEFLDELNHYQTDFQHIDALHNFYPREGTGLNVKKLQHQNELLHKYNISVGAFIPSYNKARSPIKKGLPTLEIHRYQTASLAMRHLKLLGIDSIFIGDSLPTEDEIQELANLTDEYILLKAKKLTQNKDILKTLQENIFTARLDEADGAIRTQESRALFKQIYICPEYIAPREIGSITLDNALYARYAGEMQIITHAQKKDNKINTIAKLLDSELILLPYIKPNSKFKIKV